MVREYLRMWRIWCPGLKQRVENSRSSLSTLLLKRAARLYFLLAIFGM